MKTNTHFWTYLVQFFLEWERFSQICTESQNTHLCSITFFEDHVVYRIMWKNTVESGRRHMTIWRIRIACWIPKATNTYSEYVILTNFLLQQWLHECTSMLRFTYSACLSQDNWSHSLFRNLNLSNGEQIWNIHLTTVSVCSVSLVFRK